MSYRVVVVKEPADEKFSVSEKAALWVIGLYFAIGIWMVGVDIPV